MGILNQLVKQFLAEAAIVRKVQLSEAAYYIQLKGESIKNADFVPGYFLRLGIGIGQETISFQDAVRSYSVWDMDKANGTIDLAIATQSKGAGAKWVEQCQLGDKVYFKWKKGHFLLDDQADSYLMIGDLSALAHLYVIRRNLPPDKSVESIVYSQYDNDLYPDVDGATPFHFYKMPPNPYQTIIDRLKVALPKMSGRRMVYIGGDSRICVALTHYFRKELRWEARQIKTKPFWNPDKKGLE
jgi:NADPH-dependent ferric siderophore reductase